MVNPTKFGSSVKTLLFLVIFQTILFQRFIVSKPIIIQEKCLYWKNIMKIACGYIQIYDNNVYESHATINWYWTDKKRKILESFDSMCPSCDLENELIAFQKKHKYVWKYVNGEIWITGPTADEDYRTEQSFECYMCLLKLYT